ncbi:MAG: hypothetical protein VXY93_21315, partial [Pseudomonadota bacterium]|nr:hypothetical protein [Pseudomonadota bacterium]
SMGAGSIYVTGNTSASEAIMHFGVGHNISHGQVPRLSIKGDGEVGIGTDNPDTILHVRSSFPTLLIEGNNDTVGYTVSKVDVRANYYRKAGYVISGDNGTEDIFMGRPYGQGDTTVPLVFNFQGSEKFRFSHDGKIGINTTNPYNKQLSVETIGLDDNTHLFQTSYRSGNNAPGYTAT